jgi:hypothetical protein
MYADNNEPSGKGIFNRKEAQEAQKEALSVFFSLALFAHLRGQLI